LNSETILSLVGLAAAIIFSAGALVFSVRSLQGDANALGRKLQDLEKKYDTQLSELEKKYDAREKRWILAMFSLVRQKGDREFIARVLRGNGDG
jgi:hypothetical protein